MMACRSYRLRDLVHWCLLARLHHLVHPLVQSGEAVRRYPYRMPGKCPVGEWTCQDDCYDGRSGYPVMPDEGRRVRRTCVCWIMLGLWPLSQVIPWWLAFGMLYVAAVYAWVIMLPRASSSYFPKQGWRQRLMLYPIMALVISYHIVRGCMDALALRTGGICNRPNRRDIERQGRSV